MICYSKFGVNLDLKFIPLFIPLFDDHELRARTAQNRSVTIRVPNLRRTYVQLKIRLSMQLMANWS
jgi:hypothetical protein